MIKKSGSKRPWSNDTDVDIVPAPDSEECTLVSGEQKNMTVKIPAKKTKVNNNDTSDICGLNDFVDLERNSYFSTENNKLKSLHNGILCRSG